MRRDEKGRGKDGRLKGWKREGKKMEGREGRKEGMRTQWSHVDTYSGWCSDTVQSTLCILCRFEILYEEKKTHREREREKRREKREQNRENTETRTENPGKVSLVQGLTQTGVNDARTNPASTNLLYEDPQEIRRCSDRVSGRERTVYVAAGHRPRGGYPKLDPDRNIQPSRNLIVFFCFYFLRRTIVAVSNPIV